MCSHWCSEMFIKNLLKLALLGEIVCLFCIQNFGSLFSQKASVAKGKQMLVLGSTRKMCVMLTSGSRDRYIYQHYFRPLDRVLVITAKVGKIDDIPGERILLLYWSIKEYLSQDVFFPPVR